jgi:hypothetical protein
VVKAVLLDPLPYPDPGRRAWLTEINDHGRPMQSANGLPDAALEEALKGLHRAESLGHPQTIAYARRSCPSSI